jgi:uncharacterized lipoprotein
MKKILLLIIVALLLNGCRYVDTREVYVDARAQDELEIPEGLDKPNSSSTLEIPEINENQKVSKSSKIAPPDMPIRTKQSEDGSVRIENEKGYPLLTAKVDKAAMLEAMQKVDLENWSITSVDEEACVIALTYVDQAAKERENANFIKKIFTRKKFYSDYSGVYQLICTPKNSVTQARFSKQNGDAAKSFIADNVMTKLYDVFTSK